MVVFREPIKRRLTEYDDDHRPSKRVCPEGLTELLQGMGMDMEVSPASSAASDDSDSEDSDAGTETDTDGDWSEHSDSASDCSHDSHETDEYSEMDRDSDSEASEPAESLVEPDVEDDAETEESMGTWDVETAWAAARLQYLRKLEEEQKDPFAAFPDLRTAQAESREDPLVAGIRYYQTRHNRLIPEGPFEDLVREVLQDFGPAGELDIDDSAMRALQAAAEAYLVQLFEDSNLAAIARRPERARVLPRDFQQVRRVRGERA